MFTTKNIYRNSWLLHLIVWLGVFSACTDIDDEPTMVKTRSLTISRVAIADEANVETARVLVFNESKNLVSNSGCLTVNESMISDNNILTIEKETIIANIGTNYIYVILNEGTAGFTDDTFSAVTTIELMEQLRAEPIEYKDLIKVNASDEEPAFLMCVYDEIEVTSATTSLNITGLGGNKGFSMRRTMAKIVLESVVGGVKPDGTIVGTDNLLWNGDANVDQDVTDKDNNDLIATSAIHILGIDLINVPTHYSWKQEKELSDYPIYERTYKQDPISLASSTFHKNNGYFDRTWDGDITASGIVPFTRVDALYSIWKTDDNKGSKPYEIISEADALKDPNKYYNWVITGHPDYPVITDKNAETIPYAEYNKTAYNYGKYTIDENGIIHLWNTSGVEMDVPKNSSYLLNSGNFIEWFKLNFGNSTGNFEPGTPVAGTPSVTAQINPAVWVLNFNQNSYYIPENIPKDGNSYTKLRITASIAIPTAILDNGKVNEAINKQDTGGTLIQDEGTLDMSDANIQKYMFAKGTMTPYTSDSQNARYGYHSLKYSGLNRVYTGEVKVDEGRGQYDAITGMTAQIVTIEIPLNNDMVSGGYDNTKYENESNESAPEDHNIYRGREYHVKLYVTKQGAWNNQTNTASRTINIGGEELTITGKVVTKPMK